MGLGIGSDTEVYAAFGTTPEARATRFEEQIEVIKALWTQPEVTFKGKFPGPGQGYYRPEASSAAPRPNMDRRPRQGGIGTSRKVRRCMDGCGSIYYR